MYGYELHHLYINFVVRILERHLIEDKAIENLKCCRYLGTLATSAFAFSGLVVTVLDTVG